MRVKLMFPIFLLLLFGCSSEQEAIVKKEVVNQHAEIVWFDGTVEEAFAQAAESGEPLFLYWGAVWCPPCKEIKSTVFKSPEFIDLTKLFIPVYLDGDTSQAQAMGERFGVMGYPTMIVFNSAGEEVTRLPGDIDIDRYNTVLALSLDQMRPTRELVQLAMTNPAQLTSSDYQQLAYYSWGQDASAVPGDTDKAELFSTLAEYAPEGELSTRFYLEYLVSKLGEMGEDETEISGLDLAETKNRLTTILSDRDLTLAGWGTLAYYADDLLDLIADPELEQLWSQNLLALRMDATLSKAEKMAGWLPYLHISTRNDAELDSEDAASLRAELAVVDKQTPDAYERQSVIYQMSGIYRRAGLKDDAKTLLLAELKKSRSAYYFMSGLASMAEKDGQVAEALKWQRKAWENSTGQATRFQWGSSYVRALIRLSPENAELITETSMALLAEFDDSAELFAGRNFRVLKRTNKTLATWRQEQELLSELAFAEKVRTMCDEQQADSLESENCQALLVEGSLAKAS